MATHLRDLSEILRDLIARSGLTQEELGERLGVRQNRISDLIHGEKPHVQKHMAFCVRLTELCKEFRISPWKK